MVVAARPMVGKSLCVAQFALLALLVSIATASKAAPNSPPTAPGNLTATAVSYSQIDLDWTAATDDGQVDEYSVETCQGTNCSNFFAIATVPAPVTFWAIGGLQGSTSYSVRVRARDNKNKYGPYSNVASATTFVAPPPDTIAPTAPGSLTATAVSWSQIDLNWTAASDNVGVVAYSVERCKGTGCSNFSVQGISNTTHYFSRSLQSETSYTYRVRAYDAADNYGPYSNVATATTLVQDTIAPTVPGDFRFTAVGPSDITLSWTVSTDNVAVAGYELERCSGIGCSFGTFTYVLPGGSRTSFNDPVITAGTSYSYRIKAYDAENNFSPYSAVLTAVAGSDATAPTVPTEVTATAVSASEINLSWAASTDDVSVTGYRVERCKGVGCSDFVQVAAPTGTSHSSTALTPGTSYSFRVRATDGAGNLSEYSAVASATTLGAAQAQVYFIHTDHLNTPRLVADATGTTVWRWDQAEPFGNNPADEDPNANSVAFDLPLRLPGQHFDKETGLAYNMARDYASETGRYIQSDPIGLAGGVNTYAYVRSNPLSYSDPLGLINIDPAVFLSGGINGQPFGSSLPYPRNYNDPLPSNNVCDPFSSGYYNSISLSAGLGVGVTANFSITPGGTRLDYLGGGLVAGFSATTTAGVHGTFGNPAGFGARASASAGYVFGGSASVFVGQGGATAQAGLGGGNVYGASIAPLTLGYRWPNSSSLNACACKQ